MMNELPYPKFILCIMTGCKLLERSQDGKYYCKKEAEEKRIQPKERISHFDIYNN